MAEKTAKQFEENFRELCDWFAERGIPPSEGFSLMALCVGAIIATHVPKEKRGAAVELARESITDGIDLISKAGMN